MFYLSFAFLGGTSNVKENNGSIHCAVKGKMYCASTYNATGDFAGIMKRRLAPLRLLFHSDFYFFGFYLLALGNEYFEHT